MERQFLEVAVSDLVATQNGRTKMDKAGLESLAASIKTHGIIEPIIVKRNGDAARKGTFSVIAGHRRLAAANLAGLTHVPCIVREADAAETAEIRAIENLMRENLSEHDEAAEVAGLVALRGMEAIPELAERTGLSPFYLRRLHRVTKLPEKAQKAWKAGKLTLGHMEQLLRVPEELLGDVLKRIGNPAYFEQGPDGRMTVEKLRDLIDKMNVELTLWPIRGSACETCASNSQVQEGLFGFTLEKAKGARCMNPECFRTKACTYYAENWTKTKKGKALGTSGPVFIVRKDVSELSRHYAYIEKPKSECRVCDHFVTLILSDTAEIAVDRACNDLACYKRLYDKKKAPAEAPETKGADDPEAAAAARTAQRKFKHGWEEREAVYAKTIPGRVPNDEAARVALAALLHHDREGRSIFARDAMGIGANGTLGISVPMREILAHVWKMRQPEVLAWVKTISVRTVLRPEFGQDERHAVYTGIGRKLEEDWAMTEEFLQKKTKEEIVAIAVDTGLFKAGEIDLDGKKAGIVAAVLDAYKKAEKGAGTVPAEVMNPNEYREVKKNG
ncbi:MAG: Nucleoid occlusion protein [Syntrophaceae bacterium PtaU1.Bin231]|nr:MAG: Nucleoid occlusion protein [Syntrophaceae bacterium PtaU1.Bin231]